MHLKMSSAEEIKFVAKKYAQGDIYLFILPASYHIQTLLYLGNTDVMYVCRVIIVKPRPLKFYMYLACQEIWVCTKHSFGVFIFPKSYCMFL